MHIIDDVELRTPDDYQAATDAEVDRLRSLPEVVAVYSTGMVKAPGISDLDLIAVIDLDPAKVRPSYQLKKALKIPVEGYIRTHPLFAISCRHFSKIRWLADLSTLDCLTGEQIEVKSIDPTYQDLLRAVTTLETGIHKFFVMRAIVLGEGRTTRNLLLTLNSVGYSLHLADQLHSCGQSLKARIGQFRSELLRLRSNWFDEDENDRLTKIIQLLELAPRLLVEAMNEASAFLVEVCQLDAEVSAGRGTLQVSPGGSVSFDLSRPECDANWGDSTFLDWSRQFNGQTGKGLQGPIGLALLFAFYRDQLLAGSPQREFFDAMIPMDRSLANWALGAASPMREGLIQRSKIICEYAAWSRPFWASSICFSAFAPSLMGERSRISKIWARVENRLLATLP